MNKKEARILGKNLLTEYFSKGVTVTGYVDTYEDLCLVLEDLREKLEIMNELLPDFPIEVFDSNRMLHCMKIASETASEFGINIANYEIRLDAGLQCIECRLIFETSKPVSGAC